jgi:hypothetical protein
MDALFIPAFHLDGFILLRRVALAPLLDLHPCRARVVASSSLTLGLPATCFLPPSNSRR